MANKIKLADASLEQLRAFAQTHLGISIDPSEKIAKARAKVAEAWGKDEILVPDEESPQPQTGSPPRPVTKAQQPPPKGKVRLKILRTDEPGGDEAVPVSVNGRAMLIPRDKEVEIPEAYFEVLEHAVRHVYDPLPDGKGLGPARAVPMYPYQVIERRVS